MTSSIKKSLDYVKGCQKSIEELSTLVDKLTEFNQDDLIPAWMVKDLVAKAYYKGSGDCHNMWTAKKEEGIDEEGYYRY